MAVNHQNIPIVHNLQQNIVPGKWYAHVFHQPDNVEYRRIYGPDFQEFNPEAPVVVLTLSEAVEEKTPVIYYSLHGNPAAVQQWRKVYHPSFMPDLSQQQPGVPLVQGHVGDETSDREGEENHDESDMDVEDGEVTEYVEPDMDVEDGEVTEYVDP